MLLLRYREKVKLPALLLSDTALLPFRQYRARAESAETATRKIQRPPGVAAQYGKGSVSQRDEASTARRSVQPSTYAYVRQSGRTETSSKTRLADELRSEPTLAGQRAAEGSDYLLNAEIGLCLCASLIFAAPSPSAHAGTSPLLHNSADSPYCSPRAPGLMVRAPDIGFRGGSASHIHRQTKAQRQHILPKGRDVLSMYCSD
jgi:hypothetical protein